jgi:tRNA (cytidine/uridine-2'-O-)-methyltransferase
MDYLDRVSIARHASFAAFNDWRRDAGLTLVLLTTAAERSYIDHAFGTDQVLLFGRESAGVPDTVHHTADARLRVPIKEGLRSLNIAMAVAMVAGEALRQTSGFPG